MHARVYASNSLPPYMWPVLLCSVRLSSLDEVGQISDRIKLLLQSAWITIGTIFPHTINYYNYYIVGPTSVKLRWRHGVVCDSLGLV